MRTGAAWFWGATTALTLMTAACRDQPAAGVPPLSSGSAAPSDVPPLPVRAESPAPAAASTLGVAPFVPEKVTGKATAMGTHLAFAAFTTPTSTREDASRVRRRDRGDPAHRGADDDVAPRQRDLARSTPPPASAPVKVSPETFDIIKESVHASEISEGTFDITFETMHGLWKFDQDLDPHPSPEAEVRRAQAHRLPQIKLDRRRADGACSTRPDINEPRGASPRGTRSTRRRACSSEAGSTHFRQAGGDLYVHGHKPDGSRLEAGVRDPRGPRATYFAMLPVERPRVLDRGRLRAGATSSPASATTTSSIRARVTPPPRRGA